MNEYVKLNRKEKVSPRIYTHHDLPLFVFNSSSYGMIISEGNQGDKFHFVADNGCIQNGFSKSNLDELIEYLKDNFQYKIGLVEINEL